MVGTAPTVAKGTAGVEPVSGAERAAATRPNVLDPKVYCETGRGHKTPLQRNAGRKVETPQQGEMGREVEMLPLREGEREVRALLQKGKCQPEALPQSERDALLRRDPIGGGCGSKVLLLKRKHTSMFEALHREDERKLDMLPQGSPNEGKRGHGREVLSRLDPTAVRLTTWDPGEGPAWGPAGQHIFESKGPVEANKCDGRASTYPTKQGNLALLKRISQAASATEITTHLYPLSPPPAIEEPTLVLRPVKRARRRLGSWNGMKGA